MKWYHYLVLASIALAIVAVNQRLTYGSADLIFVAFAIPGILYVSSKTLEFVFNNRL